VIYVFIKLSYRITLKLFLCRSKLDIYNSSFVVWRLDSKGCQKKLLVLRIRNFSRGSFFRWIARQQNAIHLCTYSRLQINRIGTLQSTVHRYTHCFWCKVFNACNALLHYSKMSVFPKKSPFFVNSPIIRIGSGPNWFG
jgi:hypothetical protein